MPTGTTKFEKRGIAAYVPEWIPENCIQCNQCSLVCPHACIRPILTDDKQTAKAPKGYVTKPATGLDGYSYRMQVSPLDCTGCASCANVCPAKEKALKMVPLEQAVKNDEKNWEYTTKLPTPDVSAKFKPDSIKGSQFKKPLFEFSGACAGCGETPYVKLVTQLFGDRMIVANATGCSSIYGGSSPTCPYTKDEKGNGPAWANSLFEDNAEFGLGMKLAYNARKEKLIADVKKAIELGASGAVKDAFESWLKDCDDTQGSIKAADAIKAALPAAIKAAKGELKDVLNTVKDSEDVLVKKSVWIFGGDGWAYDIGYGGLDHVLASGENINVLVLDTEVYSNTGGQSSKSTPTGSVAKFAAAGKRTKKKDLGMMAMSYGYVYVAQVAMGADKNQVIKAIAEAEAYDGPSLIIAYSTCINHGIDMSNGMNEVKKAVDAGYWQLYRYNPALADQGKNPFSLDSKDPTGSYQEFISGETRYASLKKANPEIAAKLFEQAEIEAKQRLQNYKTKAGK